MTSSTEREISREMIGALHRSSGSYELVIGAIAAAFVGLGIDSLLGTRPLFMAIFAIFGFIGATYSIWHQYQVAMNAETTTRSARITGSNHTARTATGERLSGNTSPANSPTNSPTNSTVGGAR